MIYICCIFTIATIAIVLLHPPRPTTTHHDPPRPTTTHHDPRPLPVVLMVMAVAVTNINQVLTNINQVLTNINQVLTNINQVLTNIDHVITNINHVLTNRKPVVYTVKREDGAGGPGGPSGSDLPRV